jgi:protein O-mannosyl-transferase
MDPITKRETFRIAAPFGGALLPCAGLLVLVGVVFWPVLGFGFQTWDDPIAVANNRSLNPPTFASLGRFWSDFTLWFYVPVTYTVWWLLALVAYTPPSGGAEASMAAMPFHAANLVAHAANVLLLFGLLRRLVPAERKAPAWFGAAVFAVHPIQVEAVAFVATLYTSLSTTFALLSLMLYLRFSDRRIVALPAESEKVKFDGAYALATLCFILSLLTKPALATLPAIVGALEFGIRGRRSAWQFRPLAPWVLLAAAATLVTREAQHAQELYAPLWLRPFVAADAVSFYLGKFLVPTSLTPIYWRSPAWLEQSGWTLRLTWIVPALLVVTAVLFRRRAPWFTTAMVILFATLAPTLGLVTFNFQRYSTVADHYFYAAMAVMAWFVAAAVHGAGGKAASAATAVVVLVLSVASSFQVPKWKDTQSLFGNPNGPDVNNLMVEPPAETSTE